MGKQILSLTSWHSLRYFPWALLVLGGVLLPQITQAYENAAPISVSECPIEQAPARFESKGVSADNFVTPGNRGILPRGFVALSSNKPVQHGVDVSKWQASADFVKVKECGGSFAYVRISAGSKLDNELEYRAHWANARSVGLLVGPYHNLTIRTPSSRFTQLNEAQRKYVENENIESARLQAKNFLQQFREVLSLDPTNEDKSLLGLPFLPIALDVTARPLTQGTPEDQHEFSKVYGATVCAWFDEINKDSAFSGAPKMLFTLPKLYKDFELANAPCDTSKFKIWLSHRPQDGGSFLDIADPQERLLVDSICKTNLGGNRCIFEQYTSWGGFALYQPDEGLDLNRFIGSLDDLKSNLYQAKK